MRISKPLIFTRHKDLRAEYEFLFKLKLLQEKLKWGNQLPTRYDLMEKVAQRSSLFAHVYTSDYPWGEVRKFIRKYRKEYGLNQGFNRSVINL